MKAEHFIKRDFLVASPFTGVAELKEQLVDHFAVVIKEEDQYFGILTALDIVRKPHIIAIDCLSNKTPIKKSDSISNILLQMKWDRTEVLPVFEANSVVGLIFKNDVLEYLNEFNKELVSQIEQQHKKFEEQQSEFKLKIQQQKADIEKIVEQRTNELIDLVETKDKFISIIAHELKNPFNSILGFLDLLKKNWQKYDAEKIHMMLDQLYHSSTITFDLLNNLLNWTNIKNGKFHLNQESISISEVLNEELNNVHLMTKQKNIVINDQIDERTKAYCDKNLLRIIFRNLITNSIKYSRVKSEIIVSAVEKEEFIEIHIKDFGIGIKPEVLEVIFKNHTLKSAIGTANESGTGLGLLMCKEYIETGGGKIWVESVLGQGAEFKFTIPKSDKNPL